MSLREGAQGIRLETNGLRADEAISKPQFGDSSSLKRKRLEGFFRQEYA
jgi:hypothetical protein